MWWQMNELGRVVYNSANVVQGGIVCFFPSYEYERLVYTHWEEAGFLQKIGVKKKASVFVKYWQGCKFCAFGHGTIRELGPNYEGRPINKLQNGIILLIFKIWKIRNTGSVRNFILNNSCKFYHDDVTMTSFVNDKDGDATAESIP